MFSSQRAVEQHRRMVHCSENNVPVRRTRPRRRQRAGGGGASVGDIAPSRIPPPSGSRITLSGEDRIFTVDVKKDRSVLSSVSIDSGMSPRLRTIARAYQRVKWNRVTIMVTPQASATTNGGYVCGFVMDPTDQHVTAEQLSSTQGATTKKWYETATVNMPAKPDLLYTSDSE